MTERLIADAVVTCDEAFAVHRPGAVDVDDDGRISWVGPAGEAPEAAGPERRLPGVLLPGLVNTHCHSPMTLFRGSGEDLPLVRWLHEVLWPREAKLTPEDVYWGMTLAAGELLRFGVTTSCEMYFHSGAVADAVSEAGSRAVVTPAVISSESLSALPSWERQLQGFLDFADDYDGGNGRIELGLAAHGAYTLPLEALEAIGKAGAERDMLLHIHVAESREEAAELEAEQGKSVPALLAGLGFLDARRVLTAHSVWLSDDDLRIYADHDVAVAHCPQSNAKLASGTARVTDMIDAGLRVGLGTDGPASNNDLDLWEEMRLAPLLQRLRTGDAAALPARQAISLATRGGAEALGRDDIGALEAGRWADIVHLRADDAAFTPITASDDLVSHLLWSASSRHVTDVWVAGRHVVAGGVCQTVDEERARAEVQSRAVRLASD